MADSQRFAGKVAVVTGGASGIGAAVCRRLVAEGASVVAGDLSEDGLKKMTDELGSSYIGRVVNVTHEDELAGMVDEAVQRFGRLDLGFNIAGGAKGGPLLQTSLEDYEFTVALCQTAVVMGMKHQANAMIAHGTQNGAIVNVASLNSQVPMFGGMGYCTAKSGAAMAGQVAALELAEYGIRVNTVSPGLTDTPLTAGVTAVPGIHEAYMDRIPVKRAAQPEEMASACLYLASEDASYISGTNLFVDGAWAQSGYPDFRPIFAGLAEAGANQ